MHYGKCKIPSDHIQACGTNPTITLIFCFDMPYAPWQAISKMVHKPIIWPVNQQENMNQAQVVQSEDISLCVASSHYKGPDLLPYKAGPSGSPDGVNEDPATMSSFNKRSRTDAMLPRL